MRSLITTAIVFLGGFAIMVLEIIGARFLAKDFGSSFYVWTAQIGVILIALALGYYIGGALADRFKRLAVVAWLVIPAGVITLLIPHFADRLVDVIIMRHPIEYEIPPVWQKLDPAIGSALIFLLPCLALATLSPCMIRLEARQIEHVGRISGMIIAASTVGSIAGVFVSGYILIDLMSVTHIFYATGTLTVLLGLCCVFASPFFAKEVVALPSMGVNGVGR
jgi:MFS family permease